MSDLNTLLAQLTAQTARLIKDRKPAVTLAPHVVEALSNPNHPHHPNRQEATVNTTTTVKDDDVSVALLLCPFPKAECDTLTARTGEPCGNLAHPDDEHDWASYDSSDVHQRTAEWEAQAQPRPTVIIQHFTPKKLPMTAIQRAQANAALETAMPGVRFGTNLRQHKAHQLLVEFVGLDDANQIMGGN